MFPVTQEIIVNFIIVLIQKTESYGISSLGYFSPKVWAMIPSDIQKSRTLDIFLNKTKLSM